MPACAAGRPCFLLSPAHGRLPSLLRPSINRFPTRLSARVGGARLGLRACDVVLFCVRLLGKGEPLTSSHCIVALLILFPATPLLRRRTIAARLVLCWYMLY